MRPTLRPHPAPTQRPLQLWRHIGAGTRGLPGRPAATPILQSRPWRVGGGAAAAAPAVASGHGAARGAVSSQLPRCQPRLALATPRFLYHRPRGATPGCEGGRRAARAAAAAALRALPQAGLPNSPHVCLRQRHTSDLIRLPADSILSCCHVGRGRLSGELPAVGLHLVAGGQARLGRRCGAVRGQAGAGGGRLRLQDRPPRHTRAPLCPAGSIPAACTAPALMWRPTRLQ